MKKIFRLSALFCAMTLLVTSCTQEVLDEPQVKPAVDGSEIQFGARAGFENADESRTIYTNEFYEIENSDGTKTKFERIDWLTGDQIMIYSPEAKGTNPAHYEVTCQSVDENGEPVDQEDTGYLSKLEDGGLQWNGNGTHNFYALYPSPGQLPTNIQQNVNITKTGDDIIVNAYISDEQHTQGASVSTVNGKNHYEMKPDMRFAYMAATSSATIANGNVALNFKPIVTAIRIELHLPTVEEVNGSGTQTQITEIPDTYVGYVQLTGTGIAGAYTANLSNDANGDGYPDCTNVGDGLNTIRMEINDANNQPVLLKPGESLFFTVFVRPGASINLSSLKVGFGMNQMTIKSKSLQATSTVTQVVAMKKNSLTGLRLPYTQKDVALLYDKWISQMRDDATILELSLPGTGGSFSYAYNGSNPAWYKQQVQPVFTKHELDKPKEGETNSYYGKTGQWDLGIRAFEIACNRPDGSTVSNPGSLDSQPIRVNQASMGNWTVGAALRALLDKVTAEGSEETAMAIITYQSEGGSNPRHGYVFALALKALYNTLESKYPGKMILYTPGLKLGTGDTKTDARGKLMIVCRINQAGEVEAKLDEDTDSWLTPDLNSQTVEKDLAATENNWTRAKEAFANIPILLINGCGTAKDRWNARGYQVSANGISYSSVGDVLNDDPNAGSSVEYYMLGTANVTRSGSLLGGYTYTINSINHHSRDWNVKTEGGQYSFGTSKDSQMVWYQEWARVVNLDYITEKGGTVNGNFYECNSSPRNSWGSGSGTKDLDIAIRWHESYSEKVADAKATFDLAISKDEKYANYVFINSLCGYLVDPAIENSWTMFGPATSGPYTWSGGTAGNIEELAKRINPEFGGYVRGVIAAQGERGATGVVMMDYVSEDSSAGASYYLPSVIISNNIYTGAADTGYTPPTNPDDGNDDDDDDTPTDTEKPGGGSTGGDDEGSDI